MPSFFKGIIAADFQDVGIIPSLSDKLNILVIYIVITSKASFTVLLDKLAMAEALDLSISFTSFNTSSTVVVIVEIETSKSNNLICNVIFFNKDIQVTTLDITMIFFMTAPHIHSEGCVSQIFHLSPSFDLM